MDNNYSDLKVYNGDEPYIFVSYSHKNKEEVFKILEHISACHYRLWFDEGLSPGDEFAKVLHNKIKNCCAMLIFLSDDVFNSNYCKFEIFTGYVLQKRLCPLHIQKNVKIPEEFTPIINSSHQLTLQETNISDINGYIEKLPREAKDALIIDEERHEIVAGELYSSNVVIPKSIVSIHSGAYKGRHELRNIDFGPDLIQIGEEGFRSCESVESLSIPGQVRVIGDSAFRDCINLKELHIAQNSEGKSIEIGERAFENCIKLQTVDLPIDLKEIFGGCFNSCKSLESILIPEEVTSIGENAFGGCSALRDINIPQGVTKIDDLAFSGCSALTRIELKEGLLKIGKNAFKDCTELIEISIPSTVTKIGTSPFRGCTKLENIIVDKSRYLKHVDGVLFNKNKSQLICFPANKHLDKDNNTYSIPDSVTEIGEWAFADCSFVEKIIIPDSVTEIGEGAFYKCKQLKSIEIPDSVLRIDDTIFRGCENLTEVTISESVIEIGWGIFSGCSPDMIVKCKKNSKIHLYCEEKQIQYQLI
ncbi:MAG: leucine-rich repeat protein [Lachnospiraceae bacterium]|nr:leucine-rich repeat protein [Lachnospiraceae bacterium]